ncbi:ROK family protein [Bifidobacterium saguini DSM 23967]|uniref:ROK family protein n=3 Tax=Bifidobacterium TaxID=1678 RepID=A0A2N5ITW2_9BIFI|nr:MULTISPECIES: ROK family protein [Bifidobacterium]KFI92850.1 ROK family protein [Bifidobacterium saguini DSM 23967]PLS25386.1 ROK family transcriptional regulator [Bifidobacterium imperatoris]QSY58459.1 ROK family protein [Bifidobacterium imperatoris]QTB91843.1 ROK family protein [Bifidobacterium saguini]
MSTYLSFDIGGTKVASGFVTLPQPLNGEQEPVVTNRCEIPTEASRGGDDLKARIVALAAQQLERASAEGIAIAGIGIAAAGVPDSETGVIVSATDILPGWRGQHIYDAFAEITDLPVRMIGDVGAHGLGEASYGAGRNSDVVLSIGVGTGIGGAIVMHGELFTGAHGVAGHAGHVPSALGQGFLCSCGTREGHIEPVASGTGLKDLYNHRCEELSAADKPAPVSSGAEVASRAAAGEQLACSVLADSAHALGECIGGMGNLIDPDVIVISGSVVKAGALWWDALRAGFTDSALALVKPTPLVEGELGGDAPLIGAAAAIDRYVRANHMEPSKA